MKKFIPRIFIALWMAVLLCLFGYYLFFAPRESAYSPEENRNLAGFPAFSVESLTGGEYAEDFENYMLDRFPLRQWAMNLVSRVHNALSFASHEEYLLIAEGPDDPLDNDDYQQDLEDLLGGFTDPSTEPTTQPTDPIETTSPMETTAPTEPLETTAQTEPPEYPPIEKKPAASLSDFASNLCIFMDRGDGPVAIKGYARDNVAAVTAVLNKYAAILPEGGKLMFTVVPQASSANRFAQSGNKTAYYCTFDEVVNALGADNVYAFDAAEILAEGMRREEYVYFRTDMHWTPYGSYLLYQQMVARAGKEPCSYEDDFILTVEEPFRGTYYRDNPAAYMDVKPDRLDLLMPDFPLEWRRITQGDEYTLLPFLDFNARSNDRYTVYLGGPAGPWTYAQCDNGQEEACLLITDSYGLGFLPFLTTNYSQVHYYDARYFSADALGCSVSKMMEKYGIRDVYVVVGDLHSFESSYFLTDVNKQFG